MFMEEVIKYAITLATSSAPAGSASAGLELNSLKVFVYPVRRSGNTGRERERER